MTLTAPGTSRHLASEKRGASQVPSLPGLKCPLIVNRNIMPSAECRRLALQSSIHALTRTQDRRVPIVHRPGKHELDARAATGTIGCDEAGRLPRRAFVPCMCSDQFPAVVGDGAARRANQGRARR
jgi:hypothetical protein